MVGLIGLKSGGISNTPFKLATIGATRRKKIQTKIKANFYFYFSARQVPVITLRKCYRFSLSLSLSLSLWGPIYRGIIFLLKFRLEVRVEMVKYLYFQHTL